MELDEEVALHLIQLREEALVAEACAQLHVLRVTDHLVVTRRRVDGRL
jgi:hypothetical protein